MVVPWTPASDRTKMRRLSSVHVVGVRIPINGHCGLVRGTSHSSLGDLDDDGNVDHKWVHVVHTWTPIQSGWVTSVVVVVVPGEPKVLRKSGDDDGSECNTGDRSPSSGRVITVRSVDAFDEPSSL